MPKLLQLLHTNICGPTKVPSAGGKYFVTVLGDYSKMKAVKPIARKSYAPEFVQDVMVNWETKTGHKTVAIRHNRAKEDMAEHLRRWYAPRGIEMQPTSGYCPQENGDVERFNRTLWETTLAYCGERVAHAVVGRGAADTCMPPQERDLIRCRQDSLGAYDR